MSQWQDNDEEDTGTFIRYDIEDEEEDEEEEEEPKYEAEAEDDEEEKEDEEENDDFLMMMMQPSSPQGQHYRHRSSTASGVSAITTATGPTAEELGEDEDTLGGSDYNDNSEKVEEEEEEGEAKQDRAPGATGGQVKPRKQVLVSVSTPRIMPESTSWGDFTFLDVEDGSGSRDGGNGDEGKAQQHQNYSYQRLLDIESTDGRGGRQRYCDLKDREQDMRRRGVYLLGSWVMVMSAVVMGCVTHVSYLVVHTSYLKYIDPHDVM